MDKKKLRQCAEGLIVTAAGLGYVLLSLGIRRNPVKTDGFWGLLTEAKFLPLLLSKVGFTLPTAAYLTAILFLLNRGRRPLELLLLSGVYCLAALLLIPGVLGLQLL